MVLDSYPCFFLGGFYPSDGWVGGMGQFGMISPHGFALFRLGIRTGPFPSPTVPQFGQSDAFQGYTVHLCVLRNRHTELGTW